MISESFEQRRTEQLRIGDALALALIARVRRVVETDDDLTHVRRDLVECGHLGRTHAHAHTEHEVGILQRCLDPTFLRGPAYGLMPEDKRSPVASRRGIPMAAAAV